MARSTHHQPTIMKTCSHSGMFPVNPQWLSSHWCVRAKRGLAGACWDDDQFLKRSWNPINPTWNAPVSHQPSFTIIHHFCKGIHPQNMAKKKSYIHFVGSWNSHGFLETPDFFGRHRTSDTAHRHRIAPRRAPQRWRLRRAWPRCDPDFETPDLPLRWCQRRYWKWKYIGYIWWFMMIDDGLYMVYLLLDFFYDGLWWLMMVNNDS